MENLNDWTQVFTGILQRPPIKRKLSYAIAPAQFIFNPLQDSEVVINDYDQRDTAVLVLGSSNYLRISIINPSLEILGLFGNAHLIGKQLAIKGFQEKPCEKFYICIVRTYAGNEPTQEAKNWIVMPKVRPQVNNDIELEFDRETIRHYFLTFDLLPDDQENIAYFGENT